MKSVAIALASLLRSEGASNEEILSFLTNTHKVAATTSSSRAVGLTARIIAYSKSQRGRVWHLGSCSSALGVDRNSVSAALTPLCKNGTIVRTGHGEYRSG
jgi:hypothetical protein